MVYQEKIKRQDISEVLMIENFPKLMIPNPMKFAFLSVLPILLSPPTFIVYCKFVYNLTRNSLLCIETIFITERRTSNAFISSFLTYAF